MNSMNKYEHNVTPFGVTWELRVHVNVQRAAEV